MDELVLTTIHNTTFSLFLNCFISWLLWFQEYSWPEATCWLLLKPMDNMTGYKTLGSQFIPSGFCKHCCAVFLYWYCIYSLRIVFPFIFALAGFCFQINFSKQKEHPHKYYISPLFEKDNLLPLRTHAGRYQQPEEIIKYARCVGWRSALWVIKQAGRRGKGS